MKTVLLMLCILVSTVVVKAEVWTQSFDYGTVGSSVMVPYTKLAGDLYSSGTGYGWQSAVQVADRTTGPSALDRDFNRNIGGTGTFLLDVPNMSYDLYFRFWEQYSQGPFDVTAEGSTVIQNYTWTGGSSAATVAVSNISVADGQLAIGFPTTSANWFINGLTVKRHDVQLFDFGQASSTVMLGWNKATGSTAYSSAQGYGWNRTVDNTDRATGNVLDGDMCRDLSGVYSEFLVDMQNGLYNIKLTIGDKYAIATGSEDVYIEGIKQLSGITWTANQYNQLEISNVLVTDGQMNIGLANALGGSWVISNMQIASVPEPATIAILTFGTLLVGQRRRHN